MGKPFLDVLSGNTVETPPIWLMRQAGRYLPEYREQREAAGSFLNLCFTPDRAIDVTLQPVRRFSMDAAILFSDILVIPHALGQRLAYIEGEGPQLKPVRSSEDLAQLNPNNLNDVLAPVYSTVRGVVAGLPPSVTMIGFAGSPWTVACYMVEGGGSRDFLSVKSWAYSDPNGFSALIDLLVDATVEYLSQQIEAGADVVQLFDSWAGILPAPDFEEWVIKPTARIVQRLKETHPDTPIIGFPRLAGTLIARYVAQTGVDAVGLDTGVSPAWAVESLPETLPLQGNLDPIALMVGGDALDRAVDHVLGGFQGRRHLFNLGHGILPKTPPENVQRLIDRVRRQS